MRTSTALPGDSLLSFRLRSCFRILGAFLPLAFSVVAHPQTASVTPTWVQRSPATVPASRNYAAMVYDTAIGKVVLFGGYHGGALGDTWTYDGKNWAQITGPGPTSRYTAGMAYDAATQQVILFGGRDLNGNYFADTWAFDGTSWTNLGLSGPSGRQSPGMSYDPVAQKIVLFGGIRDSNALADTWIFNGTWTQSSATGPAGRFAATMVYDPVFNRTVLFGGRAPSNANDTWFFDGTNWAQALPISNPPARSYAMSSYDPGSKKIALFGGLTTSGDLADTWVYNGDVWAQLPITGPLADDSGAMATDDALGLSVLFGGTNNPGTTWTFGIQPVTTPSVAVGNAATQTPVYFTINSAGMLPALTNSNVVTQGISGLDFTLGTGSTCTGAVSLNQTCTVNVAFTPIAPGLRHGAVNLKDANGNVLATAYVSGTGMGALATFTPGTISTFPTTFNGPDQMATDAAGNVYLAEINNQEIRKIDAATGVISVVAGIGVSGFSGDGGPATSAKLGYPQAVALDGAGNLYIADYYNNRIRKVLAATGVISTLSGDGTQANTGDGGLAVSAEIQSPVGIALDTAGNIYVSTYTGNTVREISAATGMITTIAGTGASNTTGDGGPATSAAIHTAYGLAIDSVENLFIAEYGGGRVREVSASTGVISTIAGSGANRFTVTGDGGPATSAPLGSPIGIALDAAGNLYIADESSNIRKVEASTGIISSVAGNGAFCSYGSTCPDNGPATTATFSNPYGVAVDNAGDLYISDYGTGRLRKITATAAPVNFANTAVNATSASQTVTVNNIGNAGLALLTPSTGQNPSLSGNFVPYSTSSTSCPVSYTTGSRANLYAGTSCTETLSFSPTVSGSQSGNLMFTDNSNNGNAATQAIYLGGNTVNALNVEVGNASAAAGATTVTLTYILGYSGTAVPTGATTITVYNSTVGVGTPTCTVKGVHNNCTFTYIATGGFNPGSYVISVAQAADSTYAATSATGTLTITGTRSDVLTGRPTRAFFPQVTVPSMPVQRAPGTFTPAMSIQPQTASDSDFCADAASEEANSTCKKP